MASAPGRNCGRGPTPFPCYPATRFQRSLS
jgi:hypothetical protein